MINALWYPPNSGSADVRPWDANGSLTPRAHGDYDSNTATSYGLMLAYNQFSGNTALQSSGMGGYGRKGAQRLVILETDGLANASTSASTTNAGAYQAYFNIGTGQQLFGQQSTDSDHRRHQRRQSDLRIVQRFELWPARFLDHGQAGLDPVHRLRGDLRAHHAVVRQLGGDLDVAVDLDDRRLDVPQFGERSDQRLQVVHRHASPTADRCCSKPSRKSWTAR